MRKIAVLLMALLFLPVGGAIEAAEVAQGEAGVAQTLQREPQAATVSSMVYYKQGASYEAQGDYAKALACYDQAIVADEKNKLAYNAKGAVCYQLGRFAEAHTNFTLAIVCDPDFAAAYQNRSKNYRAIGAEKAARAEEARWRALTESTS